MRAGSPRKDLMRANFGATHSRNLHAPIRIDRYQLRAAKISRCCDCARNHRIEVISHPEGVDPGGDGSQINGSDHRGRGPPRVEDLSADTNAKSFHVQGLSFLLDFRRGRFA